MNDLRIGLGHDTHRIEPGGPLRLGGIDIEFESHLAGHSDADVLLHAITDGILGAANLPDIGQLFPDNAAENLGRDSAEMLRLAADQVTALGWKIINLDCVVMAQRPKLSPHKAAMQARIASILEIEVDRVGLKAKTGEGVGEIGRGEIMQAQCVVLLSK